MLVINSTNKRLISNKVKYAQSFWDRAFGMILKSNSDGLVIKTRFGIHTFFMRQKIDLLILDNNSKVVKIVKNLAPNRFFFWIPIYQTIIELPSQTLIKTQTKLGDKITFDSKL